MERYSSLAVAIIVCSRCRCAEGFVCRQFHRSEWEDTVVLQLQPQSVLYVPFNVLDISNLCSDARELKSLKCIVVLSIYCTYMKSKWGKEKHSAVHDLIGILLMPTFCDISHSSVRFVYSVMDSIAHEALFLSYSVVGIVWSITVLWILRTSVVSLLIFSGFSSASSRPER